MNIKSILKSLGYIVFCSIIALGISFLFVNFLAQGSELQQLSQNYDQVANELSIPWISEFLARSHILLEYHPLRIREAGIWWVSGGLLLGIILGHFRKGRGLIMISGILEPVLVRLFSLFLINLASSGSAVNSSLEFAGNNIPGGLVAGIGGLIGVALGSTLYPIKIKIPEELFEYEIEPFIQVCPKCNTKLHSNAIYCESCGALLNSESLETTNAPKT